jgi:two-component system, OmpR family, response regulator
MTKPKHFFKLLIVEDEGDMCLVLEMILNKDKMSIDHVKRISAATEYLQTTVPDLILLDNRLPDGLGIDLIPYLKRFHPGVKILMISAKDGALKDLALHNGADMFLQKPFTRMELISAVDQLLLAKKTMSLAL